MLLILSDLGPICLEVEGWIKVQSNMCGMKYMRYKVKAYMCTCMNSVHVTFDLRL